MKLDENKLIVMSKFSVYTSSNSTLSYCVELINNKYSGVRWTKLGRKGWKSYQKEGEMMQALILKITGRRKGGE